MTTFYYIILFVLGASLGSFINAWVWRTHEGISLFKMDRSICPKCRMAIKWYDNIPILSYVLLKGSCRKCSKKISFHYPLVELAGALLFVLAYYANAEMISLKFILDLFILLVLLFIFVYDFLYQEILDRITLPAIIIIFIASLIIGTNGLYNMIFGLLIGAGFFLAQYFLSKGKWIGGGDIRLGALMGVILGLHNMLLALFLAYVIGAIVSFILIGLKKKKITETTPFGTYLTLATVIAMFWGYDILEWYFGFLI
ncbi:MAG: prepilin peptidase [Candidatus Magasanikbacteria bacterium]|nr:prepilin peptidase [Candidatus Magasanikbacteria bacterium]